MLYDVALHFGVINWVLAFVDKVENELHLVQCWSYHLRLVIAHNFDSDDTLQITLALD